MIAALNFKFLAERQGQEATWILFSLMHGADLSWCHPMLRRRSKIQSRAKRVTIQHPEPFPRSQTYNTALGGSTTQPLSPGFSAWVWHFDCTEIRRKGKEDIGNLVFSGGGQRVDEEHGPSTPQGTSLFCDLPPKTQHQVLTISAFYLHMLSMPPNFYTHNSNSTGGYC